MFKQFFTLLKIIVIAFVLKACTYADLEVKPADSYRYFPIKLGDERIYEQITTNYAVGQNAIKDTILVKETITKKDSIDFENTFTVFREIKRKQDFEFIPDFTYLLITNPKEIISTEKNVATVRLSFPLNVGAEWNMNRLNTKDEKKALVLPAYDIPSNFLTNQKVFKLDIEDLESTVNKIKTNRYYGLDVGLLFLEDTNLEYVQDEKGGIIINGKPKIESGQELTLRLIKYTKGK